MRLGSLSTGLRWLDDERHRLNRACGARSEGRAITCLDDEGRPDPVDWCPACLERAPHEGRRTELREHLDGALREVTMLGEAMAKGLA